MAVRSLCSTSQHSTTWRSDHCVPPVNTVPHGGQIISQHRTTWRSDHRAFHQSTQYHMVRSSANTVPHGGQIISQYRTTWWSDHQPTPYHMVARSSCGFHRSTVPQSGQMEICENVTVGGEADLSSAPSPPPEAAGDDDSPTITGPR